jgi:ribonuclease VapC
MTKIVLDASAMLALLKNEPGAEKVEAILGKVVMSSINIAEVAGMLLDSKMSKQECMDLLKPLISTIVDFDFQQALIVAELKQMTKNKGLSLGDRACIAVGLSLNLPVYTADKVWCDLPIQDLEIKLIR